MPGFILSFDIPLLYQLDTVACIPERLLNCSDLWDLLRLLFTEPPLHCAGYGLEAFRKYSKHPGKRRICKVVLDKGDSKGYNNTNWRQHRHLAFWRGIVIIALQQSWAKVS